MLENQRHLFDIPENVTYLNCAYLSPLLRTSADVGRASVTRKVHPWTIVRRDFFDELENVRALFARLINANLDDIALVPASSYAAAIAGQNLSLREGQAVIVVDREHFSNVYQWKFRCRESGAKLVVVSESIEKGWTQQIIDCIDERTAVVSVPQCHWHDGSLIDLDAVSAATRTVGASLVIDGTQSIGAVPFDIRHIKPSFLFCSAYKWLLGPYGVAFLYSDPVYQQGAPLEHHSYNRAGADKISSTSGYSDEFMPGARRYDFGERSNFIILPMLKTALQQLLDWGADNIQQTLAPMIAAINSHARELGLNTPKAGQGSHHFTGLRFPAGIPPTLESVLAAANIYVSVRGETLRVSPHLYNSASDIGRLFDVLARAVQN